jgi:hypothetical protein
MMSAAADLYSQALGLPPDVREEVAMLLFERLPDTDDSPIEVSVELEQEIQRRLAERQAGTAKTVDVATFTAAVRAAAKRPASS